jgi:very-short-patch-repair endonuclease
MGAIDRARGRRYIVVNQRVTAGKVHVSRELRRNMTEEERLLWNALRTNRLGGLHFRRQQIIDGFVVDFYCHAAGLVIKVDGAGHQDQTAYDEAWDHILAARNLLVLRFSNGEVRRHLTGVLTRIAAVARERLSQPMP